MKYLESKSRSAEHLRAALPLMTRQATALHPISYAVWYEFVSGGNPDLAREIEQLTHDGTTLDDACTRALFRRHVAEPDNEAARQLNDGLTRMLESIAASATQAGEDTARLDGSLSGWVDQLLAQAEEPSQAAAPATQAELLQQVVADTREIRQVMGSLQQQLDASQGEIQRLREEVQRARSEAFVDALTGLANRRAFEQRLEAAGSPCALVLGDIDFFKNINDSFGHAFGDQVLRAVAQTLQQACTGGDALAARVGGEEFALLLPGLGLEQARMLADHLRQKVSLGRVRRGGQSESIARVTISLGVAERRPGESSGEFFERADRALYASKRDGRNRVTADGASATSGPVDQPVQLPAGKQRQQHRADPLHA
ncbi:GGDEF domain-containing protein [Pelomonas sp. KK5]|uniref:GGDEF domain-containing protein n=1 Tax=Pelomonas sp. KK5 TaxID=1855730 RepID=UPI00097C7891|nr:diguanylate cyclase [Pelomonas sp. KK5]